MRREEPKGAQMHENWGQCANLDKMTLQPLASQAHAPSRGKKRREIQGGGCVALGQSRSEDTSVKICTLTPF